MPQTPDKRSGADTPKPPPRPAESPNPWAALDADFRDNRPLPPEDRTQLPTVGFSGRFWKVDLDQPADPRVRYERPILLVWLLISCLWQGFLPWLVLALALIVYALTARRAFRPYDLGAQTWVYSALGLGQIMLACSYLTPLGPFWPFIGLYWLGVLLAWGVIEGRRLLAQRGHRSVF